MQMQLLCSVARRLSTLSRKSTTIHGKQVFRNPHFKRRVVEPIVFTDIFETCRYGSLSVAIYTSHRPFSSDAAQHRGAQSLDPKEKDEESLLEKCPGCGVRMQSLNPNAPGFFKNPTKTKILSKKWVNLEAVGLQDLIPVNQIETKENDNESQEFSEPKEEDDSKLSSRPTVCARCHSLRYYGKVKDEQTENLLPAFDFDATIGPRLTKTSGARITVLMVVDLADFDGSFPRRTAVLVSKAMAEGELAWKKGISGNVPRLVLAATKLDLLPTDVTPERLEKWVRQRARFGGAYKLHGVHLVSAHKSWGIRNLAEHVKELTGARGAVWVIGAQNAGKSTLINAIGKHFGGKVTHLTEAPVPGTTLGIIRVDGILGDKAKLFDTPGLLHPYQISTRLNSEEQRFLHIKKRLRPKTYRLVAGQCVHIGGLARIDIRDMSVNSLYLSVWASPHVPLHMGKIENAESLKEHHFGVRLQPPIGADRVVDLGEWKPLEFEVSGNSWEFNSMDIAISGLGWVAFSLRGEANISVWTYDGIEVVKRSALILDRARFFEDHGFTVSNVVSGADKRQAKEVNTTTFKKPKDTEVLSSSPF